MSTVGLTISGMSCQHCVRAVRQALDAVAGVSASQVDIGSALVSFDPALVSVATIERALLDAGYESEAREADA
jgi:copper chaperone